MRFAWYALTLVFGLFGLALILRGGEVLISGGFSLTTLVQMLMGALLLGLAQRVFGKAKGA